MNRTMVWVWMLSHSLKVNGIMLWAWMLLCAYSLVVLSWMLWLLHSWKDERSHGLGMARTEGSSSEAWPQRTDCEAAGRAATGHF